MLERIKSFIKSIKTPKEKQPDWIGLGVAEFFGLREDHRLFIAAAHHDASQDAIDVFLGKKKIEDCASKPIYYKDFVRSKLRELETFVAASPGLSEYKAIKLWIRLEDDSFFEMTSKLKRTRFQHFQGILFYQIVRIYSFFKYRKSYVK